MIFWRGARTLFLQTLTTGKLLNTGADIGNPNTAEVQNNSVLKLPGNKIGRRGLEKVFDAKLRGKLGSAQIEVNALGREVKVISQEDSTQGLDQIWLVEQKLNLVNYIKKQYLDFLI